MVGRYVVGLMMISGLAWEAAAADFDASSGKLVAQSGDYLYRFDDYFPTLELLSVSGPILESDARARFEHNQAKAIEGSGYVRLGGTMAFGWLPIVNADRCLRTLSERSAAPGVASAHSRPPPHHRPVRPFGPERPRRRPPAWRTAARH